MNFTHLIHLNLMLGMALSCSAAMGMNQPQEPTPAVKAFNSLCEFEKYTTGYDRLNTPKTDKNDLSEYSKNYHQYKKLENKISVQPLIIFGRTIVAFAGISAFLKVALVEKKLNIMSLASLAAGSMCISGLLKAYRTKKEISSLKQKNKNDQISSTKLNDYFTKKTACLNSYNVEELKPGGLQDGIYLRNLKKIENSLNLKKYKGCDDEKNIKPNHYIGYLPLVKLHNIIPLSLFNEQLKKNKEWGWMQKEASPKKN